MLLKFIFILLAVESCLGQEVPVEDHHLYAYRVGCYIDKVDDRDMPEISKIHSKLTVRLCFDKCRTKHFKYAGVQNGKLCFCGDSYGHHGDVIDDCKTPCIGDPKTFCGGPLSNEVYETGKIKTLDYYRLGCFNIGVNGTGLRTKHYSRALATKHFCFNYCSRRKFLFAGVQGGKYCHCGDAFTSSDRALDTDCFIPCSGDRRETCGGRTRIEVFRTDQEKKLESRVLGCFNAENKTTAEKDLPNMNINTDVMTQHFCLLHCKKHNFKYAGVQAGRFCSCADVYGRYGKVDDAECSDPCTGHATEKCGGALRNFIFESGYNEEISKRKVGCFTIQDTTELVKLYSRKLSKSMTRIFCYKFCKSDAKFKYAYLVTGNFCYCDKDYQRLTKTLDAECNKPCSGDQNETCGGNLRKIQEVFRLE